MTINHLTELAALELILNFFKDGFSVENSKWILLLPFVVIVLSGRGEWGLGGRNYLKTTEHKWKCQPYQFRAFSSEVSTFGS